MKKKVNAIIFDVIIILLILGVAIFLVAYKGYDWKEFAILFLAIYLIDFIFIFYMLIKEDELHEKFVWVFFLVLFPIIAHIIFALFRIRREPGISRSKYEAELSKINDHENENQKNISNLVINDFEKQQVKLIKRNFYWSNVDLYFHGFEAYEQIFKDLENATKYIHIQMYIIKKSEIFEKFKDILIKKAQSGVEVKIILDSFGSWLVRFKEIKYLIENNVQVLMFNKTIYPIVRPTDNNRLHRKFFIIDGQIVHAGGLNISDEYGSYSEDYGYWADLNFKLVGPIVNDYERLFLYDWIKISGEKIDFTDYKYDYEIEVNKNNFPERLLLLDEGPGNEGSLLENALLNWIYNTKTSIKISTPYFIPTKQIFNAFLNALKKGVDVEFYIPGKPDKKIIYYGTYFYLKKLLDYGAKVYIINDIFLHSKLAIFDNEFAYIGTNNLDMRSFYTNYELINIIQGEKTIARMNKIFDQYKIRSKQLFYWNESKFKANIKKIIYEVFAPLM